MNTTTTSPMSPSFPLTSIPQGRWLHYGINKRFPGTLPGAFSEREWNKACEQAVQWRIQGVTPKVAEGATIWYDERGLKMLRDTAHQHGLHIIPMHYVYGDLFGKIFAEVSIAATLGAIFGAYIPDMERAWANQPKMMTHFGALIRQGNAVDSHYYGPTFSGPIYPTTYGNPGQHSEFPYVEMNAWGNGWLPQVYFNLWTFNGHLATAEEAESHVYGQWVELDRHCVSQSGMHLKPVLPLIGLEPNPQWKGNQGPSPHEVSVWLTRMQYYGYCGFWSDETYAPYAQVIEQSPLPQLRRKSVPLSAPVSPAPLLSMLQKSETFDSTPPLITVPPVLEEKAEGAPESQGASSHSEGEGGEEKEEKKDTVYGQEAMSGQRQDHGPVVVPALPPTSSTSSPSSPLPPSSPSLPSPDVTEVETQLIPVPPLPPSVQEHQEKEPLPEPGTTTGMEWATGSTTPAPTMGTSGMTEGMAPVPSTDPTLAVASATTSASSSSSVPPAGSPSPANHQSKTNIFLHGLEGIVLQEQEAVQQILHPPVFSEDELRVLWNWDAVVGLSSMNTKEEPFYQKWRTMLEDNHQGDYHEHIGYPTHSLAQRVVGSVTCTYLTLSSGLMLIQFDPHGPVYVF